MKYWALTFTAILLLSASAYAETQYRMYGDITSWTREICDPESYACVRSESLTGDTETTYNPSKCQYWGGDKRSFRYASEHFFVYFSTPDECVSYCLEKHGNLCVYSPEYKTIDDSERIISACIADDGIYACSPSGNPDKCVDVSACNNDPIGWSYNGKPCVQIKVKMCGKSATMTSACIADDGIYACSTSGNDCSDAVGCEGKECTIISVSDCGKSTNPELTLSDFGVVNEPVQARETTKTAVKFSLCPACTNAGAIWCEDSTDARKGYCVYKKNCRDGYFERNSLEACDASCTTSRDGIEPVGECLDVLKSQTRITGGYFVAGLCQSRNNAAYQCFVGMGSITGCQSCLEAYGNAVWCKGTAEYCAFGSDCVGDAVMDATQCSDYQTAQYPVDVTPEETAVAQNQPQVEDGSKVETSDWWTDFVNWFGLA